MFSTIGTQMYEDNDNQQFYNLKRINITLLG